MTPRARAIPLSREFVDYLRADGIVLPPEDTPPRDEVDNLGDFSDDGDEEGDPSTAWPEIHARVKRTIAELGGTVTPKLNWSSPKDATWMSATNDLQCQSANDVYLLLKSSDFITHDLEHAFDGCMADIPREIAHEGDEKEEVIPYHLILRKYVNFNPSLEFRCFVRDRVLICLCQRDQNHFDFLFSMRESLLLRIQSFFDEKLKNTFPDPNFVFDVYVPTPGDRVWLVDVNPWAERTDPLLFSWMEILEMKAPIQEEDYADLLEGGFVRLAINQDGNLSVPDTQPDERNTETESDAEGESASDAEDGDEAPLFPEFRLVKRDDPEAYAFSTPQYSAHKLPREVVDASLSGPGGMREFMGQWQDILEGNVQGRGSDSDSDDDDDDEA